jgi:hypothetical protein
VVVDIGRGRHLADKVQVPPAHGVELLAQFRLLADGELVHRLAALVRPTIAW